MNNKTNSPSYEFVVVGAGIFGVATALELRLRGYQVALLNPGTIPHPLAASTDISKAVRMEYGGDLEYLQMAVASMKVWREWNEQFNEELFHEVGFLLLTRDRLESESYSFERNCYQHLQQLGFEPQRLTAEAISKRFPGFSKDYVDGIYHAQGGYALASKTLKLLATRAQSQGVAIFEGQTAHKIISNKSVVQGVTTKEGMTFSTSQVVLCAGNFTPFLLPELKPYFRITGHPVFHLKPKNPKLYQAARCPVFGADISNTGWYGFPIHPSEQVVKIGKHSLGKEVHPEHDTREVTSSDVAQLRTFLRRAMPGLVNDQIVYTRLCCYTDTLDSHYWIDRHPEIQGLTVGSGGSGHGFKMAPIIGKMIVDRALGENHGWSNRYQWRELDRDSVQMEEARYNPL